MCYNMKIMIHALRNAQKSTSNEQLAVSNIEKVKTEK